MQHQEYLSQHHVHCPPWGTNRPPGDEETPETAVVLGPFWTAWGWQVIWLPSDGVARPRYFPSHHMATIFAKQIAARLLIDAWIEDIERVAVAKNCAPSQVGFA